MDVFEDQPLVQVVNRYYTPPLCLFGTIGNFLSVYVFCMTSIHRNLSSSYYLSALAISDIGFLINLFAVWLTEEGFDVMTTRFSCPFVIYSGQVMCFVSVWFVVAFTAERFCAVCYPLTRPAVCTVARAKKVILGITIMALVGFSYVWIIADVILAPIQDACPTQDCCNGTSSCKNDTGVLDEQYFNLNRSMYVCSVPKEYQQISGIASHVDSFLTLILPFCVITFLNFRITLCVWKLKGQRETIVAVAKLNPMNSADKTRAAGLTDSRCCLLRNGVALSTEPGCTHAETNGNGNMSFRLKETKGSVPGTQPYRTPYHSSAAEVRVTKTLLLVSTVFLVLNFPSHAIRAFTFIQKQIWGSPIDTMEAQQWANILFNTNFSVNFLLYCVSGRNFRKSLRSLCFWDGMRDGRRGRFLSKPTSKTQSTRKHGSNKKLPSRKNRHNTLYRHTSARLQAQPAPSPTINNREMSFYPTSVTEVETYA